MENKNIKIEYFDCECSSSNHILRIVYMPPYGYDKYIEEPQIYSEVQLPKTFNIFKRIILAIKYIFNINVKYGYWDCWLMRREDCKRFKELMEEYEVAYKEYDNEMEKINKDGKL